MERGCKGYKYMKPRGVCQGGIAGMGSDDNVLPSNANRGRTQQRREWKQCMMGLT